MLWKWGARSVDMELYSSRVRFDSETLYLHLCYSSENRYIRRCASNVQTITVQGTTTMIRLTADQRPGEIGCTTQRKWGAKSADGEPNGSQVCFEFRTLYLHLFYTRENQYMRQRATYVQAIAVRGMSTMSTLSVD